MRHPWERTLREFIDDARVRGYQLKRTKIVTGPKRGPKIPADYLIDVGGTARAVLPSNLDPDEVLDRNLLYSLCVQLGIPPDDFGLERED